MAVDIKSDYILCVDDEVIIVESLKLELRREFGNEIPIMTAMSGEAAIKLIDELKSEGATPALVVSDQRMPGMDGSELIARIRKDLPNVFFIILTGFTDLEALKRSVNDAGLFRFITKPWSSLDLKLACRKAIELRASNLLNRSLISQLEALNRTIASILESLIDCNDPDTYDHTRKVACFAAVIAAEAGQPPLFQRKLIVFSSLHDLGKVGIPQAILGKPGILSEDELALVRTHVSIGERLVRDIDVDPIVRDIIKSHHERWDGSGYPQGLRGDEIPLAARIVAIADVLDALLADRPYKKAIEFDEAAKVIVSGRGSQFDPALVDAFSRSKDEIRLLSEGSDSEKCFAKAGLGA